MRARSVLLVALVHVLLLVLARSARAEAAIARMHLEVETAPEARSCATAETLRARIAERLGRDPFTDETNDTARLRVVFAKKRGGFTAAVALEGAKGERLGARSFERDGATCEPLVTDVVLVAAVLLEDLAPRPEAPVPPPPPPPEPSRETPPPDRPPPSPPPAPRDRPRLDFALGAGAGFGVAPSASTTGEITAGFDVARFRVEAGARATLPASSGGDVAVRAQVVSGRVAPCYGWRVLSPCGVLAIGRIEGEATGSGVVAARSSGQLYAGAGVGLVSRLFVAEDLVFVRASVEVLFALARAGFDVGTERVWSVPAAAATATLGIGVRLP